MHNFVNICNNPLNYFGKPQTKNRNLLNFSRWVIIQVNLLIVQLLERMVNLLNRLLSHHQTRNISRRSQANTLSRLSWVEIWRAKNLLYGIRSDIKKVGDFVCVQVLAQKYFIKKIEYFNRDFSGQSEDRFSKFDIPSPNLHHFIDNSNVFFYTFQPHSLSWENLL